MRYNNKMNTLPAHQSGTALLVAMIMIFMLAIMGVSSMKGSTLERRMASNAIQTATTFQGAESASEMALNDESNLTEALNATNVTQIMSGAISRADSVEVSVDLQQNIGLESKANLRFTGIGPAYGYSSNFVAYRFIAEGTASIDAVRSSAQVTQGSYRIAPNPFSN